jgi:pimeloyl-ACP methyl ester carboxylesterase
VNLGVGSRGSAVLVHGGWGNPEDWRWVRERLERAGVSVAAPDLPSHRSAEAGFVEDVAAVRDAIRSAGMPVVVVGWSYGAGVVAAAAVGRTVTRLVFVTGLPVGLPAVPPGREDVLALPQILDLGDGTFVLDNDWWLDEEAGTTFPDDVRAWLREHPRRPMSWSAWVPLTEAAWDTAPSTFLVGTADPLLSAEERDLLDDTATRERYDIRTVDADHFLVWRYPDMISEVVLEALQERAST